MCFSAIYWPASVSDWCDSCSLHRERKHDIPRPRTASGLGGALPALASQSIHYECARVHCLLSPDVLLVVWQAARTILSDSLMHWWLSFLGYGSSGGCYAGRHCSYSDTAYSFLQNGSALRGGVNMYGVSVELFAA